MDVSRSSEFIKGSAQMCPPLLSKNKSPLWLSAPLWSRGTFTESQCPLVDRCSHLLPVFLHKKTGGSLQIIRSSGFSILGLPSEMLPTYSPLSLKLWCRSPTRLQALLLDNLRLVTPTSAAKTVTADSISTALLQMLMQLLLVPDFATVWKQNSITRRRLCRHLTLFDSLGCCWYKKRSNKVCVSMKMWLCLLKEGALRR